MSKITSLSDISNLPTYNTNNDRIESALQNTLSRDGSAPNDMEASLDMNGHRILNLPDAVSGQEPVTLSQAGAIAGVENPLTRETIGEYLYPATDAEVTAGVTIVNDYYPPGNVLRYGTNTSPGTTDMTTAIQAAIDQGTQTGGAVPYASPGTYKCISTIYVTCSIDFRDAIFDFGTDYKGKAVVISPIKSLTPGDEVRIAGKYIHLPSIQQTKSALGWAGVAGSYGLYVVNANNCRIYDVNVAYFETGAYFTADSTEGTAYNQTFITRLLNNKIQLHLRNHTTCWVNENQFYGGRFQFLSAEGSRVSGTKQIYLEKDSGSTYGGPNTNTFYSPSIEGGVDEYCVHIKDCVYNSFISARYEAGGVAGKTIYLDGTLARLNTFVAGYGLDGDATGSDGTLFVEANGAYGNLRVSPAGTTVNGGNAYGPVFGASHHTSGAYPAFAAYHYNDDVRDRTQYTAALSGVGLHIKNRSSDALDRVAITNTGFINLGDGTNAADVSMSRTAANVLSMADGDSFRVQGTWDGGMLRMGAYYLWVDGTGKLRIKSGAPANETDGTIVGTQS